MMPRSLMNIMAREACRAFSKIFASGEINEFLAVANIIVTWYSMIVRFFFPNFRGKIKLEFVDIN